MSGVAEAL